MAARHQVLQRCSRQPATGQISREVYEIRARAGRDHSQDFLTVGSMGHASSIALGIALEKRERSVFCLDGDGAFLMHMGATVVNAFKHLPNFRHVVLNNEAHDSVGSGSEVTQFAVVYVNGVKTSLDDPTVRPEYALVDSAAARGQSPYLRACTGLDALCHAIESYWNVRSTEESRAIAREAILLVRDNLVRYVNDDEPRYADVMAKAANLAGEAINMTRTTAAHAFSYAFTQRYGLPHGHAVALTIAQIMHYNRQTVLNDATAVTDPRGGAFVCRIMDELADMLSAEPCAWFQKLFQEIGIESHCRKLGITDVESMLEQVNTQRLANNPLQIDKKAIMKLMM